MRQARQQFVIHCGVITAACLLRRSVIELFTYLFTFYAVRFVIFVANEFDNNKRYYVVYVILALLSSIALLLLSLKILLLLLLSLFFVF